MKCADHIHAPKDKTPFNLEMLAQPSVEFLKSLHSLAQYILANDVTQTTKCTNSYC